jgi:DNA-binding transcriptional LysR family regulator
MELRNLRYFVAVAEELHFGRAARKLHITQPGLSQGVKVLEREMNLRLFIRNRRQVQLTTAGEALLPAIRGLLTQADELERRAALLASGDEGSLVVGYTRSAGVGPSAALLAQFRRYHPKVKVRTSIGHTTANVEEVLARFVDVGFVRPPVELGDELGSAVLMHEPVLVAVPDGHQLADSDEVRCEDLDGEDLVFFSDDSGGLWESMLNAVYGSAETPRISRVEPDEAHMLAAVAEGAGITLLTSSAAAMLNVPGAVVKPLVPAVVIPLALVWRRDNANTALVEFLKFARERANSPEWPEPAGER